MKGVNIKGKKVILGVSASIAAYKACDITRELVKSGAEVFPLLTENATKFIGKVTLEALSGNKIPDYKNNDALSYFQFLKIAKEADLFLIAPATANLIARLAHGFAADMLETVVLARNCPMLLAPAMNERMWLNKITQDNIEKLKKYDVKFIGPDSGDLACGDEGVGKLAAVDSIIKACNIAILSREG